MPAGFCPAGPTGCCPAGIPGCCVLLIGLKRVFVPGVTDCAWHLAAHACTYMSYMLTSETRACWRQVAQGMLWVWGDSGAAAHIHAAAKPAQTAPWMDMQARPARALRRHSWRMTGAGHGRGRCTPRRMPGALLAEP